MPAITLAAYEPAIPPGEPLVTDMDLSAFTPERRAMPNRIVESHQASASS